MLMPGSVMICDEGGQLVGYVYVDMSIGDIGGYVDAVKRVIAECLMLFAGYMLLWKKPINDLTILTSHHPIKCNSRTKLI